MCRTVGGFLAMVVGSLALHGAVTAARAVESPTRQYQAQWIWGKVKSQNPSNSSASERPLNSRERPDNATAYITADTFYRLWINGQLVLHGPARSSRGKATVDSVDVGHYLDSGQEHAR